jgi:hypothetical protein
VEADWEVEIGPEAPVIEALWPGFIDLQSAPERIVEIEETRKVPALAVALLHLNRLDLRPDFSVDLVPADARSESPIWTSKCDLWALDSSSDTWDPDELDAAPAESEAALACYIDMLGREASLFAGLDEAETWARAIVHRLRQAVCRCCRADLVIRRVFKQDRELFGITVYTTACGADTIAAERALSAALVTLVSVISAPGSNSAQTL